MSCGSMWIALLPPQHGLVNSKPMLPPTWPKSSILYHGLPGASGAEWQVLPAMEGPWEVIVNIAISLIRLDDENCGCIWIALLMTQYGPAGPSGN